MDEIDAALDFKNVSIVANYIKVGHSIKSMLGLENSYFIWFNSLSGLSFICI